MPTVLSPGTDFHPNTTLARLLWSTGPELFAYMFHGDRALWTRLFAGEWRASFGFHSAADSIVARDGSDIHGVLVSFPARELGDRGFQTFRRYHTAVDDAGSAALQSAASEMGYLFHYTPDDALMVFNLAVVPGMRGKGIGKLLMAEAEARARRLGLTSIHLDTAARRTTLNFYKGLGFEPIAMTRLLRLTANRTVPSHIRLARQLG